MTPDKPKPKITLIMVMSANGVVAQKRIEDSFVWNSEADRVQFLQRVSDIGTAIMGANTYQSIGGKPYDGVDFYVLTNHPDQFEPHDRVQFVKGNASEVCRILKDKGLEHIALLGGPTTNRHFLERELVDDIYLTIEPALLPGALQMVNGLDTQIRLELINLTPLNEQKTLLLHYRVLHAQS